MFTIWKQVIYTSFHMLSFLLWWFSICFTSFTFFSMDVGQNGRPFMGPQMWMSSLVFTIQLLGYLILTHTQMAMNQYLLIPFLEGWTSIYQLFWCELQGDRVLTHPQMVPSLYHTNSSPSRPFSRALEPPYFILWKWHWSRWLSTSWSRVDFWVPGLPSCNGLMDRYLEPSGTIQ